MNNDTIVSEGWLGKLVNHITSIPNAGMVGPVTNAIGNEAKVSIDYLEPSLEAINQYAKKRAKNYSGKYFEIKVLATYCCIISKELFDQVGGLDERYGICMFDDDDLAMKVKQQGLKLYCVEDTFIHHFHGASINQFSKFKQMAIFHINKFKFERKWKTKWSAHQSRHVNQ